MSNRFIGVRLRKDFDEDIFMRIKDMNSENLSELVRTAIRRELGITKQRVIEVREVPLPAPKVFIPRGR